jgi:hypothetical protein
MDAAWASLIAVGGTLLGSLTTHLFQRLNNDRAERLALQRRLREERLASYSAFIAALVEYRRTQYDRVNRRIEDAEGVEHWPTP